MTDMNSQKLTFEIDLENQKTIGKLYGKFKESNEIAIEIGKSISSALSNISDEWLSKFLDKIESNEFDEAYNIFDENRGTLEFSRKKDDLISLKKMDFSRLDASKRKEFLIFLVFFSAFVNDRSDSLSYIDQLLTNYSEDLETDLLQNIILEKANCLAISGHINSARINYNKVLKSDGISSATLAWAYQGLSKLSDIDEDKIMYAQNAADFHFQSGNKLEAIKNLIVISDSKGKNDPTEAINILDKCVALFEEKSLVDRELLASLIHKKSNYLYRVKQLEEAFTLAEKACDLRRGLIGNEIELCSSLSLAEVLANLTNQPEKVNQYRDECNVIKQKIKDVTFSLKNEVATLISNSEFLGDELLSAILESNDEELIASTLLYQSTNKDLSLDEAMALLDKCRIYAESKKYNHLLDIIYFCIAEKYKIECLYDEAYTFYIKSLKENQFNQLAAQNCLAMLFEEKNWKRAQKFIKERMEIIGELPNICFAYAKALFEDNQYFLALKYFGKSDKSIQDLNDYISQCLERIDDSDLVNISANSNNIAKITAEHFYEILDDFARTISTSSRMHFWEKTDDKKDYKWVKSPEEKAKQLLVTFLNGKLGIDSTEIIQECKAGAGYIDLYIILPGGLKAIVELKMCGGGYSSTYAISGESQIIHYQQNKPTKLGYLVVFDGRTRDYGKNFKKIQEINGHIIYTVAIDMRCKIQK